MYLMRLFFLPFSSAILTVSLEKAGLVHKRQSLKIESRCKRHQKLSQSIFSSGATAWTSAVAPASFFLT